MTNNIKIIKIVIFPGLITFILHSFLFGQTKFTVGASGCTYTTIEHAYSHIPATPTGGYIIEIRSNYNSSSESFPITLNDKTGADATNYIRITVASGVNEVISGNDATAIINFDEADYVIIDGSPGSLRITNTHTSGAAILFDDNATYNHIQNCTITGRYRGSPSTKGVVYYMSSGNGDGNSFNTITDCNISSDGNNYSTCLMYSDGNATRSNDGNVIYGCNIYNWGIQSDYNCGIYIADYSNGWEISGNSFYQTRIVDNASPRGYEIHSISLNSTTINGFNITDNYIGGSAPQCGGSAWALTDIATPAYFRGIYIIAGIASKTSVSANIIKNIYWACYGTNYGNGGVFTGILVLNGDVDIGTSSSSGNTIGDSSTSSIQIITSSNIEVNGILSKSKDVRNICFNKIGSFTINNTYTTSSSSSFDGINYTPNANMTADSTFYISNNTIGNTITANSIYINIASTALSGNQYLRGIVINAAGYQYGTINIDNNTIANLTNGSNSTNINHYTSAIYCNSTATTNPTLYNIKNNIIHSISSSSQSEGTRNTANMNIIHFWVRNKSSKIVGNIIYDISNTTTTNRSINISGIYYETPNSLSGALLIEQNRVYDFYLSSANNTARINGIDGDEGSVLLQNNMIGLGYDEIGDYDIRGIHLQTNATSSISLYYNTIAIGGTVNSGSHSTFSFVNSYAAPALYMINNIFINERCGGTGKHVSLYNVAKTTDFISNYNCLYSDSATTVVWYGAVDGTGTSGTTINTGGGALYSFSGWQALSFVPDSNSISKYISFIDPVNGDFHISFYETDNHGIPLSITTDYDGETRNVTNPDIGADEKSGFCWTGELSTTWTKDSNWTSRAIPDSWSIILIPAGRPRYPILSTIAEASEINIEYGATLDIIAGGELVVADTLRNFGIINIKSTSTGCGCLKNENPLEGDGYINLERYLTGGSHLPYHYIGVPIKDQPYWKIRSSGDYVPYWYDESIVNPDLDIGWTPVKSGYLTVGRGYAVVSHYTNRTFTFSGTPENFPFTKNVTYTATSGGHAWVPKGIDPQGWNLISNPFTCPIKADEFLIDNLSKLDTSYGGIYFWDDSDGSINRTNDYATYTLLGGIGTSAASGNSSNTPNGDVSNAQGFFIKVISGTTDIVFETHQSSGSTSPQFFIPGIIEEIRRFWLGIYNPDSIYNQILIGFTPFTTMGIDHLWDARKLKGNPKLALYSLLNNEGYSIQALPILDEDLWVELGIEIGTAGTHTFKIAKMENMNVGNGILLIDKYLNITTNLISHPEYTFYSEKGIYKNRFRLIFQSSTLIHAGSQDSNAKADTLTILKPSVIKTFQEEDYNDVNINFKKGFIIINNLEAFNGRVLLYDISGKLLFDKNTKFNANTSIPMPNLSKGTYLMHITSLKKNIIKKFIY